MQGASGIGLYLLRLGAHLAGRPMTPNGIDNLEGVLSADRESTPASR